MHPRFSVVIPVRDRADVIGRAVVGVLAQTFADLEVLVVDDGSTDDTVAAARAVADGRVRVLSQEPSGAQAACRAGLAAASGRWSVLLDADTEVAATWLARLGRLVDATGGGFVTCGGEQRHPDGTATPILPGTVDGPAEACLRPGAWATSTVRLVEVAGHVAELAPDDDPGSIAEAALNASLLDGDAVVHTPEVLVAWNERPAEPPAEGDELRLTWAFQGLEALARTPIPDGELLARYATFGGVAAARLRRSRDARLLFRIACRARPEVQKNWARLAVSHVTPLSRRVWESTAERAAGHATSAG